MDRVFNEIERTPNEYTAIDLIEDLMSEIQNYSTELAILYQMLNIYIVFLRMAMDLLLQ